MFKDFDFSLLDDPDFKEDSVREELVLPIIKGLGYSASGDARVVRSKSLVHPYVAIGSQPRKISIIPDYLFKANDEPLWVLDAKSPQEDILKSKHVEQAYSYAIHPEIRAEMYALCNGREFALYEIRKFEPILHFKIEEIDSHWEKLFRILNSEVQGNPGLVNYAPDFGIYLKRIGASEKMRFIAPFCRSCFIAKVEDGVYTTITTVPGDIETAMSLDFDESQLLRLLSFQSEEVEKATLSALKRQPYHVTLDPSIVEYEFGVVAHLSDEVIHNAEESYLPFQVSEFSEFGSSPNLEDLHNNTNQPDA
ncbi:type I restriction enzyme HsdR N-terminal domain-containing protein [Marinobacter daepoensis]|uniref:type I restriction enzyme HsdR N-terminal domain-containing protein n=1 Tax=Marinobacter daepoensis TaxID=262077 RepID=UPI000421FCF5|nr:type I restriction enzyme HsdR N-terminal domain-containing protein [Marinobacter daepoensis]